MNEQPKLGVHSMPAELYHKAAGCSKSMLDILAEKTPAHLQAYKADPPEQTDAMRFGTILHRALLEPDTYTGFFHTRPKDFNFTTKDGKAWKEAHQDLPILGDSEAEKIARMVSAVHTHPFAKRLLAGCQSEQSIFVEDHNGTLRKSRLDALTKGNVIPDIKTCESAATADFERSVAKYRLYVQAAYYISNCRLAGIEKDAFFFICVEKTPPYAVRCLKLQDEVLEAGRLEFERDLQVYRNCMESGIWPAYEDQYSEIGLPAWQMKQLENAYIG